MIDHTLKTELPLADAPAQARPHKDDPMREDLYEVTLEGHKIMVGEMIIPIRLLVVDDAYQRSVNESRARRYAVDWSQALAGLVTVSARMDGTYAILDGQHRARAAQIRGLDEVWAEVFFDLTPELEAQVFRQRNSQRVATNSLDDFRAAVAMKDLRALDIQAVLAEHGLRISAESSNPRAWACISALFDIQAVGALNEAINLIRIAWPEVPRSKERSVVLAVGAIAYSFKGKIDIERWKRRMETAPLTGWMSEAKSLRISLKGREADHLARTMIRHYDSGLQIKLGEENLRTVRASRTGHVQSD